MKVYKTLYKTEDGKYLFPLSVKNFGLKILLDTSPSKDTWFKLPFTFEAESVPTFATDGYQIRLESGQFAICYSTIEEALAHRRYSQEVLVECEIDNFRWCMGDSSGIWVTDFILLKEIKGITYSEIVPQKDVVGKTRIV